MKHCTQIVKLTALLMVTTSLLLVGFAATIDIDGGLWSYGGRHTIGNWGAYSNYFHTERHHHSTVVRSSDGNSDTDSVGPRHTSKAFINTKIGERARFYYGF